MAMIALQYNLATFVDIKLFRLIFPRTLLETKIDL